MIDGLWESRRKPMACEHEEKAVTAYLTGRRVWIMATSRERGAEILYAGSSEDAEGMGSFLSSLAWMTKKDG